MVKQGMNNYKLADCIFTTNGKMHLYNHCAIHV